MGHSVVYSSYVCNIGYRRIVIDVCLSDELKRRREFVAGRRAGGDVTAMTSSQQQVLAGGRDDDDVTLLPGDLGTMTSLCCDDDDVSVCLQLVGDGRDGGSSRSASRSVFCTYTVLSSTPTLV